jgi:DNA-binding NarL/FixJ family response regulator
MREELHSQDPASPLSPRELAVVRELSNGVCNREIASSLGIAEAAVYVHLKRLLKKIGAQNRVQAGGWALDREIPGSDGQS